MNYAEKVASWARLLWLWRRTVSFASMPNLVRLIRSAWVSESVEPSAKRAIPVVILNQGKRVLLARLHTSDVFVLDEILNRCVYSTFADRIPEPDFIIDCGANVGYSSIYFLQRFPNCRILAIEPDSKNFDLCCQNLASEMRLGRAAVLKAAVWSGQERLVVNKNGPEWARTVARPNFAPDFVAESVEGYSLRQIVEMSGFPYVDILKIDVEGAELEIFRNGLDHWLVDMVKAILIELHGPRCEEIFYSALEGKMFSFEQSGAYLIATNESYGASQSNAPKLTGGVDRNAQRPR